MSNLAFGSRRLLQVVSMGMLVSVATAALQAEPVSPGGDGLIAHWTLDDGAGLTAGESVHGSNGVLGSGDAAPIWLGLSEGKLGGALRFDGDNDHVDIPVSSDLDPTSNAVTISLWTKLRELPSQIGERYNGIYDSYIDSYVLYLDNDYVGGHPNELRFKVMDSDGTAERPGVPQADLVLNEWLHIVGVYDGSAGKAMVYMNGVLKDTHENPSLTGVVRPGQAAGIGTNAHLNNNYFNGDVDDITVWERALALDEIQWMYNDGNGRLVQIMGDVDLSGCVDDDDLSILLANWNTYADWRGGDLDNNGFVADNDLSLILAHWNDGIPPMNGAAIPEPATLSLLAAGWLALIRRRR